MTFKTDQLNTLFRGPDGKLWMLRAICMEPTCEFVNVFTKESTGMIGMNGLTAQGFTSFESLPNNPVGSLSDLALELLNRPK